MPFSRRQGEKRREAKKQEVQSDFFGVRKNITFSVTFFLLCGINASLEFQLKINLAFEVIKSPLLNLLHGCKYIISMSIFIYLYMLAGWIFVDFNDFSTCSLFC